MRVGFTGTRRGLTERQEAGVLLLLAHLGASELHHGDCVGADAYAHALALEKGIRVILHPPTDPRERAFCCGATITLPALPYLERNRKIVDMTEILIATPAEQTGEALRSGTWATVRYARKQGRRIYVVRPDGRIGVERPGRVRRGFFQPP